MKIIDIETYINYFMVGSLDPATGIYKVYRIGDSKQFVDDTRNEVVVTFNGKNFDNVILHTWITRGKATDYDLYELGQKIIERKLDHTVRTASILFFNSHCTHIDLMSFFGNRIGLKQVAINMGSNKIQDLPYSPHIKINDTQKQEIDRYCMNDCICTFDILRSEKVQSDIQVRQFINADVEPFKTQLFNNAYDTTTVQIAEKVMLSALKAMNNGKLPELDTGDLTMSNCLKLKPNFRSTYLQNFLSSLDGVEIARIDKEHLSHLSDNQKKSLSKKYFFKKEGGGYKSNHILDIEGVQYNFGLGGLHSKDQKRVWFEDDDYTLILVDAKSYYPSLIEQFKIEAIAGFAAVEAEWKRKRYSYRDSGDILKSNTYKLFINSIFGKLNDHYSKLKSTQSAFSVTITGQMLLLYLIDLVQDKLTVNVVNANTDGVCFYIKRSDMDTLKEICKVWEQDTGMVLDYDYISMWIGLGVNEYAARIGNKLKTKGGRLLTKSQLSGKLNSPIVSNAVINHIEKGEDIRSYIRNNMTLDNVMKSSKSTAGFHTYNGENIQKSVRYYHSTNGKKLNAGHGSKVAERCTLALDISELKLKAVVNLKIDIDHYVSQAEDLVKELLSGEVVELKEKSELGIINATANRYTYDFKMLEMVGMTIKDLYPSKTLTSNYGGVKKSDNDFYTEQGFIKGTMTEMDDALFYQIRLPKEYVVLEKDGSMLICNKDTKAIPRSKLLKAGYLVHSYKFLDFKKLENIQEIQQLSSIL